MPVQSTHKRQRKAPRQYGLNLTIDQTSYHVQPLTCRPEVASHAYRLRKTDGTLYDIAQTRHGAECDCPDFLFRRDGLDPAGCKHVQALAAYGLIPGPGGSQRRRA